jgi:hypothetical protein
MANVKRCRSETRETHVKENTMAVLLVTYDYVNTHSEVDSVLSIVQGYDHVQLSEGTYAIETDEKTRTVFNKFVPSLSKNIHLLVVTLIKPFAGPVLGPASMWLSKHLPEM